MRAQAHLPVQTVPELWVLTAVVEVLLYVHRNVGLLGTGAQDVHLDFHTAPELWVLTASKHGA